jgi:hypothetical protein
MHRYQVAKYVISDKYFSIQGKFYNHFAHLIQKQLF